jgi:Abortive infection alpha
VTRSLPGGETAERELFRLEQVVVDELKRRLEPPATTPGFAWRPLGRGAVDPAESAGGELVTLVRPMNGHAQPLRAGMAELLSRSASTSAVESAGYLYSTILRQLVPDEARILAALADGEPRPVVDVAVRNRVGGAQRVILANASTIGRAAGVSAPELTPNYLTRLHRLGLAELGEEAPELAEQYDILLTDATVRAAEAQVRAQHKSVRHLRRSVRISALGSRFWAECDPTATGRPPSAPPSTPPSLPS